MAGEDFDKGPKIKVKSHYRSGQDDLSEDFFKPCLAQAALYRRAVGYFSTSALLNWADALLDARKDGDLAVQIIASPELSQADAATLRALQDPEKVSALRRMLVDNIIERIMNLIEDPTDTKNRAEIFAWLVANDRLQIKFAFPHHVSEPGVFHEKIGIFELFDGKKIAFTGSANETISGHRRNYESIDVYRSWVPGEQERVEVKLDQFLEAWANQAQGLSVLEPSSSVIARLIERAPKTKPTSKNTEPSEKGIQVDPRWQHQDDAVSAFLKSKAGILEMATGTGKTRTALKILSSLIDNDEIDAAIVTMDGTDLLDQWFDELRSWNVEQGPSWVLYRHYERYHEAGEFALDASKSLLVISRQQLRRAIDRLSTVMKQRIAIIHDEVHGLAAPSLVASLQGKHDDFKYRLGLSATPERAYDQVGNEFITDAIGPVLYEFSLEKAISRGVLAEFDYIPLDYELTQNDRERLQLVYAKKAAREREGKPMSREEMWTEIAKVYKTAEMKPCVFSDFLAANPAVLERCILFVETKEYGEQILELLHGYTHLYRTYYAEDDRAHLIEFANGKIDCLVTCHRISQGIDISSLRSVVLFASARARLETIQRIGRCLRIDPDDPEKRATVVDFVRPASPGEATMNADQDRFVWLTGLSKVRRGDFHGA